MSERRLIIIYMLKLFNYKAGWRTCKQKRFFYFFIDLSFIKKEILTRLRLEWLVLNCTLEFLLENVESYNINDVQL